jgi:Protein of unknown function (DUF2997)
MKEMKIIISKTGQVTIDVEGIKGSGCKNLTKAMEKAFGTTVKDKKKAEFYDEQDVSDNQGVGGY